MRNQIVLRGCAPEPLIHYLKSLGIFRLVVEQEFDKSARAFWRSDSFFLESERPTDDLIDFFLNQYNPTPIITPWNNGSGFHATEQASGGGKKIVNFRNIEISTNPRLQMYRETIKQAKELLAFCLTPGIANLNSTKRSEALKPSLIPLCRNKLPDETVRWIDALCLIAESDDLRFPPLLGSAGNDGNLEFSLTFMGRLNEVLPIDDRPRPESKAQLRAALFGEVGAKGIEFSPGQFHPAGCGGVNATQGVEANYLANPWDYVLAVEGTLIFAGAAVRRLATGAKGEASFPFCVKRAEVDSTVAPREQNRGELFLPLWERSACYSEIIHLFNEGRVRLRNREVRNSIDFARAIAELGVDRGITRFQRHGFLTRNGNMQFASSLGGIEVNERPSAALIYEVDRWLDSLRRATRDTKRTPERLIRAVSQIDEAIFSLCASGEPEHLRERLRAALIALGAAEAEVAHTASFKKGEQSKIAMRPLAGLTERWANKCDDGSCEFEIAAALASITGEGKRGLFRANIEPVEISEKGVEWTNDEVSAVWGIGTLDDNLAAVLHRRSIDARVASASHPALSSKRFASLQAIDAFLRGATDDEEIESLLLGLALIKWSGPLERKLYSSDNAPPALLRAYAMLKLLFLPEGKLERLSEPIKHEPSIVSLLRAGRINDALEVADRRLRSSGLVPFTNNFHISSEEGTRLAAALLIPVGSRAINALDNLVLRQPEKQ